jgi:iron complex outermembrane receptor protein
LIKTQTDIAPGWTATFFANYNGLFQNLNDNAGETAAQVYSYGKRFALQITNPNAATFRDYNHIHKKTDMDYLRLKGDLAGGITIDNTIYTYAYVNKTQTSGSVAQTAADVTAGVTEAIGTIVGGVSFPTDIEGNTKQNAFRMWGDILRASKDFDFGWLTGQVRAGIWWEDSASQRRRFDYDATKCQVAQCYPWHDQRFADSRLFTGQKTPTSQPFNGGFYEYEEHSNWQEYQPFVEIDLHPIENLTLTPGFKYVWWNHSVAAPLEQKTKPVVPVYADFVTTRDLPFFEANYKIQPSWSVYGQYAQGIYVPDISSFELGSPQALVPGTTHLLVPPKAQTTTNYQAGTVFYADNFTVDADIYYIGIDNLISSVACNQAPFFNVALTGFSCSTNLGTAIYKGIEGEGTYAFGGNLQGLALFLNASLISGKSGGFWLKQVPMWTSAAGITYKTDWLKLSVIDKVVGQQYSNNGAADPLTVAMSQFYKLGAYNNMDFKGSVTDGMWEFSLSVSNVLNSRSLAAIGISDKCPVGSSIYDYAARGSTIPGYVQPIVPTGCTAKNTSGTSQDTYSFQPARGFQFSVAAHF